MKKKTTRTSHNSAFKAKLALEAVREQQTVPELARRFGVHANVVDKWKKQFLDNAAAAFERNTATSDNSEREDQLLKKIGELTVERDFLSHGLDRHR